MRLRNSRFGPRFSPAVGVPALLLVFACLTAPTRAWEAAEPKFTCSMDGLAWDIPAEKGLLVLKPGDRPFIGFNSPEGAMTWTIPELNLAPVTATEFRFTAPYEPEYAITARAPDGRTFSLTVITRVHIPEIPESGEYDGFKLGQYPPPRDNITQVPEWFIRLPQKYADHYLSPHFQIGQFVPKRPPGKWPKYMLVEYSLVHKLESIVAALDREYGVVCDTLQFISAYRSPYENGNRARYSRHIYGDAVDFKVNCDGIEGFDDVDGNGVRDLEDVLLVARMVQRLEDRGAVTKGGTGVYFRTHRSVNYPTFIHVDTRGAYQFAWGYVYNYGKLVSKLDW